MYEEQVIDKWVGKIVKMIRPFDDFVKDGELGKCVGVFCGCQGDIYLEVVWDDNRQTSLLEYRHEVFDEDVHSC